MVLSLCCGALSFSHQLGHWPSISHASRSLSLYRLWFSLCLCLCLSLSLAIRGLALSLWFFLCPGSLSLSQFGVSPRGSLSLWFSPCFGSFSLSISRLRHWPKGSLSSKLGQPQGVSLFLSIWGSLKVSPLVVDLAHTHTRHHAVGRWHFHLQDYIILEPTTSNFESRIKLLENQRYLTVHGNSEERVIIVILALSLVIHIVYFFLLIKKE
ncbi:hypothetical protein AMTRI_Chr12g237190 [Amborella trichopoda]